MDFGKARSGCGSSILRIRGLAGRSAKYIIASRKRRAVRNEAAPARRPFPKHWRLDLQKHPTGTMIFLRRTDNQGRVSVMETPLQLSIKIGLTAWFAPSSIWTRKLSSSMPCDDEIQPINLS